MTEVTAPPETSGGPDRPKERPRAWSWPLLAIAAGAFIVRLSYAVVTMRHRILDYDANWYHTVAINLADGHGWTVRCPLVPSCNYQPTANFGPAWPALLSVPALFGRHSPTDFRIVACVLGTGSCLLIGRLATVLIDRRVGVVAAALAAAYPMLIVSDGSLMSETPYLFLVLVVLNVLASSPGELGRRRALGIGVVVGLAALTRGEGLLLIPLVLVPWLLANRAGLRKTATTAGVAGVAAIVVMAPWTVQATTMFHRFTFTDNLTTVIGGANCRSTYYGDLVGFWDFDCLGTRRPAISAASEAQAGEVYRREGLQFAADHPGRLAVVAGIRLARTWGVVEGGQLHWESAETRSYHALELAWLSYLAAVAAAIVAASRLLRRRALPLLLVMPVVLVSVTSLLTYGNQRFRVAAEPTIVILAAVAIVELARWAVTWRSARTASTSRCTTPP